MSGDVAADSLVPVRPKRIRLGAAERRTLVRLGVEAVIWATVVAAMWIYSYEFDVYVPHYQFGTVSWPRAVLAIMAVCVLGSFVAGAYRLVRPQSAGGHRHAAVAADPPVAANGNGTWLRIGATFVLPLVYVWLLPGAGFFVTTPVVLALYMYAFGQRRLVHLLGTSLAVYAIVLIVFAKLFFLPLPTGNWPGFYEVSNALLVWLGKL